MRFRFFLVPLDGGEAERELNQFLAAHSVLSVDRQLVTREPVVAWALCVSYLERETAAPSVRKGKVDYRDVLSDLEFSLFAKLRSVRKRLADGEGVPAYAIFTNEQLAAMIRAGVRSRAELAAIDGVGEARVAKYGAAFLEVLTDDAGKGAPAKGLPADEPKQGDARARR